MTTTLQILHGKLATVIGTAAVTLAMFGGVTAATAAGHASIKACANKKTGELRLAKACHHNEKRVTWAAQGPRGEKGAKGARGPAGPTTDISPANLTQRGVFNLRGYGTNGSELAGSISFPLTLSAAPIVDEISGTSTDSHCTGTAAAPTAAPGYLCVYVRLDSLTTNPDENDPLRIENPYTMSDGAAPFGAMMSCDVAGSTDGSIMGSWAVTAP